MKTKTLRVGFDLDGVILYNPIRTLRPLAEAFKPFVFLQKKATFYFPKTSLEKWFWRLLHKTSYKASSGIHEIEKLVKEGKIEAYLITSRYSFLEEDFRQWVKILNGKKIFSQTIFNKGDVQPNVFKEKVIKDLKLDVFVEDNWGIIKKLNSATKKTKIFWITNLLDQHIPYPYKFSSLQKIASYLRKNF